MNPSDPVFHIKNLRAWYGARSALHEVNLDIPPRRVTAFMGPSGCGKTTLLRCLNRMSDLTATFRLEGEITLHGEDIHAPEVDVVELRRRVGMVFQKTNPFPKSIFDNVAYGLRLQGITSRPELARRIESSLRKAALWDEVKDRLDAGALQLSGGQQQRLCIARAIAVDPEVLLMDEPCSALDPIATARIEELVQDLKRDFTIVLVTHNLQQAARVSDFSAFFHMGRLVEFDDTKTLFTRPAQRQTEDYITGRFG